MKRHGRSTLATIKPLSVLLAAAMLATGCSRKNNPLLSTPPSGVSGLSISIPQIDGSGAPDDRIFLSVRDNSNSPLTDFQLGNFSILEGGAPGVPYEVGKVNDPLYLALVIDRSGSMGGPTGSRTLAANAAATALINALGATDSAALVEFDHTVNLTVNFTTNKSALISAVNGYAGQLDGATAAYDGAVTGGQLLTGQPGRRLLLVLTDGEDNSSSSTLEQCIQKVNNGGLSAYTVGLGLDPATNAVGVDALQRIASATGGIYYSSSDGSDLTSVFLNILDRMNSLVYVKYRRRGRDHGLCELRSLHS